MQVSRDEAQAALDAIEQAERMPRFLLRSWVVSIFVCGVIWTASFAASQFLTATPVWSLSETFLVGIAFSVYWGRRYLTVIRVDPGSRLAFLHGRLALFYGILYLFFLLWQLMISHTAVESTLLWITVVMLAAIVTGVWLAEPSLILCGVAVTVLSALGYWLLPQVFWLWVAVVAGLPLIGLSLYLWRRH